MYARQNYRSKKALKEALKAIQDCPSEKQPGIPCFQPGPFGPDVADGEHCCEGPHYPEPHRWYATVTVKNGHIVKVK